MTEKRRGFATKEAKRRYNNRAYERLWDLKRVPCGDCKQSFPPYCMDFDHRPDEVKSFTISGRARMRWDKLLTEIAKCDVVCAICHRKRTHARKEQKKMYTPPPKKVGGQAHSETHYRCGHPRSVKNTYPVAGKTYGKCKTCTKAKMRTTYHEGK